MRVKLHKKIKSEDGKKALQATPCALCQLLACFVSGREFGWVCGYDAWVVADIRWPYAYLHLMALCLCYDAWVVADI